MSPMNIKGARMQMLAFVVLWVLMPSGQAAAQTTPEPAWLVDFSVTADLLPYEWTHGYLVRAPGRSGSVAVADLDNDGDPDVAFVPNYFNSVFVVYNDGTGHADLVRCYDAGPWPVALATADLNNDRRQEIIVANQFSGGITILWNLGSGAFYTEPIRPTGSGACAVVAADLDGNVWTDLVVANRSDATVTVLRNIWGSPTAVQNIPVPAEPNALAVADFDADDDTDIAVACAADDSVTVLLNDAATLYAAGSFSAGPYPVAVTAADFDGDADIDLAVANREAPQITVLLNDGSARFAESRQIITEHRDAPPIPGPVDIAAADIDLDGDIDLVAGSQIFTNDGSAAFTPNVPLCLADYTLAAALADIDEDGLPDRLTAMSLRLKAAFGHLQMVGDLNDDHVVDIHDLMAMTLYFGSSCYGAWRYYSVRADFNRDGCVDLLDLLILVEAFGTHAE